jgi:predicted ATPase/class 3 adenylate cyclase
MAAARPSGTVTFLFTDVESSSMLWERAPEAMRVALTEHDAIVRAALESNAGNVFKTVGDAFCCAFASPLDAALGALAARDALEKHRWPDGIEELRIRIALHSGTADQRDGDYFGPAVNRTARLTAIAAGGQIVASAAASELLRESEAVSLTDLGSHRLRDLSFPERVYQLDAPSEHRAFPPLSSIDARANNLPSQFSSFIGRRRERADARELLLAHRLVTLAGPGGIGKTRLALQVAAEALERFSDGAWFVDLSAISEGSLVAQAIARELHVRAAPSESLEEALSRFLTRRQLLLVLDNSEQVLEGVATIVRTLLSACPGLAVLATSREPLHLAGEQVYRLTSLSAPGFLSSLSELNEHDAPRLFVERARAVAPSLKVADADVGAIAEICRKLDGIPLAIELAAARVSALTIEQLDGRLTEKLPLLTSSDRTQQRHRTLRATLDWSYRLLNSAEKRAFAQFSVFAGSFTLDACERVAPSLDGATLDVLQSLVEKSFVQLDPGMPQARFRYLDVIREYAADALLRDGSAESVARAHASYYAELAASGRQRSGDSASAWQRAMDADVANVRAALDWVLHHDPAAAAPLALDVSPYWRQRGTIGEARRSLSAVLKAVAGDAPERTALLLASASFATMQDDFERSLAFSHEALERSTQASPERAEALFRIAEVEHRRGHLDEATELYRQAQQLFAASGDARGQMLCVGNLGMAARQQRQFDDARVLLHEALQQAQAAGERRIAGEFSIALGWVTLELNDPDGAERWFETAYARDDAEGDAYGRCAAGFGTATVALVQKQNERALSSFLATLKTAEELGLQDYVFRALYGIAAAQAAAGDVESAATFLALGERLFRESGRTLRDSIAYDMARAVVEEALTQERCLQLQDHGEALNVNDAVASLGRSQSDA